MPEKHQIQLPGALLDQIRNKEDKGDYENNNARFQSSKKRPNNQVASRKERRKQERQTKRQKSKPNLTIGKPQAKPEKEKVKSIEKKDKKIEKQEKKIEKQEKKIEKQVIDDEFKGFSDNDIEMNSELEVVESESDSMLSDDGETVGSTMEKLMALKGRKMQNSMPKLEEEDNEEEEVESEEVFDEESVESTMAKLKALKSKKQGKQEAKSKPVEVKAKSKPVEVKPTGKSKSDTPVLSAQEREAMRRDEDDMAYYAKKLGLKGNKLSKRDENDDIGGLLDGLDFDTFGGSVSDASDGFDEEEEEEEEEESDNDSDNKSEVIPTPFSSDDEINSSDFDDSNSDEEESDSDAPSSQKENPYVAPVSKRYVPPALRKRLESSQDSEQVAALRKAVKGPLNRLSEANIATIVNEINSLYSENPRQRVNEVITSIVLETVLIPGRLLDSFIVTYSALVSALYKVQGVEFGAYFIQTTVERLELQWGSESDHKGKELVNLASLISYSYCFSLFSCRLIYDIIKERLISEDGAVSEEKIEMLLRIVRNCGSQMRSDDPESLREIVVKLNKCVSSLESKSGQRANPRMRFLVETVSNLKNNKVKGTESENTLQLVVKMKKFLGSVNNNRVHEAIQVSLDDILHVEERGKWWLVGSAWKGKESQVLSAEVEVEEDPSEINWLDLAKSQRMNTEIRRAIFVCIMSANDFMDSFTKLEKLGLKRQQQREVPKILLHCVAKEPVFNPYYAFLAKKLCEEHSMKKTLQFDLWDLIQDLEGAENDSDDDLKADSKEWGMQKILNLAKFYGFLLAEGSLPVNVLRTVNLVTASGDLAFFIEILLVTYLDNMGKTSQAGDTFDDRLMIERCSKCKEQPLLMRGLQRFLTDKVLKSDFIKGKRQRKRVEWGVGCMCDVFEEFSKGQSQEDIYDSV